MKFTRVLLTASLALGAGSLCAAPLAGPKGGRILTTIPPHAEFFVDADRKVVISFYDADLKPLGPKSQIVGAVAETINGKVRIAFENTSEGFLSTMPLPDGDGYQIVVQVRPTIDARPSNYRLIYHDEVCSGCSRAEYACTCEHAEDTH